MFKKIKKYSRFLVLPKNLYLDLENCYECKHYNVTILARIVGHSCSMSKEDPVSIKPSF